ncbi:amidohydrolase family protein [Pseudonocardia endophytica]|uniref:Putative amidohydrolase YtcJ n=1 Tax=Pseudonocardia endophytica TaxID=401976 RepID=A0A4R1HN53_PSEEN|nr:amidohydrolase family protein [Pseudonocardia endophytica]TCK22015.1 putative amidohydrolase YtcJ [Pseudonocardia endophytica]
MTLLVRDAEVDGRPADVLVQHGRIVSVTPPGPLPAGVDDVLDAAGGALLPGLADHHIHLHALAAARCSVPAGRTRDDLARALAAAEPDEHGWVRVVGSSDDALDASTLDVLAPGLRVRVQHRSGALWTLSSAALEAVGAADHAGAERAADGALTGRMFRADDWLRDRMPERAPPNLDGVGADLAGYGITAVTDATPDLDRFAATALTALPQRLTLLGVPLGELPPPGADAGPYKIVLADSDLPDPDVLTDRIRAAHAAGRGVAVHTVTRESLVLLLVALDAAGRHPGDRLEHAALVPSELLSELRGLTVVTQPGFLTDRGDDYRRDVPADEHADLYRCRSLIDAGVGLALSSDAPYGPVDPWAVVRAATTRLTADGAPLGPGETLTATAALDAFLTAPDDPGGRSRRVVTGAPADLVLLAVPLAEALRAPSCEHVATTVVGGERVHGRRPHRRRGTARGPRAARSADSP